jgi:polysaccharide chain length determinant protein (PEP-CTERM system associated)
MIEQQSFHPLDYMAVVHRRKWWFVVTFLVAIAVGAAAVAVWPTKFLSRAAIGVQSPSLSPDFLKGVSSMDPTERQRAVQQLLFSPAVIDRVIREEKLNRSKAMEEVAAKLRDNLSKNIEVPVPIGLNGRPDPSRGIDFFYLGYTDKNALRAQQITNRIAQIFVEENSKAQTERVQNTADVLQQEVADSKSKLDDLEQKLAAKKKQFVGRLPDQIGPNVQMVNGARVQYESVSLQIRTTQDQIAMLDGQLQSMRQGVGVDGMTSAALTASQATQKRLDDLQTELNSDRAKGWLDKHPEIQRLQDEIAQAKADLAASKTIQPSNREETLKSDSLYRQKVQELDVAKLHLKELESSAANAQAQITAYQSRVDAAPVAEQELASLNRDYDNEKAHYNDLNSRYQASRSAEEVARKQGGERFSVLYPADLPNKPVEPQPLKIMAIAIVAGIVLGAGAALGREFLDRSVHDLRALQNEFEVPVLGEIPRIA